MSAAFPASRIRHDTVGAEVVAAEHDVHQRLALEKPLGRQSFYYFAAILPYVDLLCLFRHHVLKQSRELVDVVSAEDDVDPWVFRFDSVYDVLLLHHAAAYAHNKIRVSFFSVFQLTQSSEKSFVCIVTNAAGVDYRYACISALTDFSKPLLCQHARHDL